MEALAAKPIETPAAKPVEAPATEAEPSSSSAAEPSTAELPEDVVPKADADDAPSTASSPPSPPKPPPLEPLKIDAVKKRNPVKPPQESKAKGKRAASQKPAAAVQKPKVIAQKPAGKPSTVSQKPESPEPVPVKAPTQPEAAPPPVAAAPLEAAGEGATELKQNLEQQDATPELVVLAGSPDGSAGGSPGNGSPNSSLNGSPRERPFSAPPLTLLPRQPKYGWVTLSKNAEEFVIKEIGCMPAHLRQQHVQQWTRRQGIDSSRERSRAMARDEEQRSVEKLFKQLRGEISGVPAPRSTSTYLKELESDPKGIGFAYGGLYPGRLHARGKHVEKHEVHFSVGVSGRYLLHVNMRPNANTPVTPLPGSPFKLHVVPGVAHPLSTEIPPSQLPLRGVLERGSLDKAKAVPEREGEEPQLPRCMCKLTLVARDKMGNRCETGGAAFSCGCMDESAPLESSWEDEGNGEYTIRWSAMDLGTFTVFVKIDGIHVLGSPTMLTLSSGTADISKTEVTNMERQARAGKPVKLRVHCRDVAGHPCAGTSCTFGLVLLPASQTDPELWRRQEVEKVQRHLVGDLVELSFVPKLAGDIRAHLWMSVEEGPKTPGKLERRGMAVVPPAIEMAKPRPQSLSQELASIAAAGGVDAPPRPAAVVAGRGGKKSGRRDLKESAADPRELVPGAPFPITVTPAEVSMKHCFIDSLTRSMGGGAWEEVYGISVNDKLKMPPRSNVLEKGHEKDDGGSSPGEEEEPPSLQVGDLIKLRPTIRDQYNNPVGTLPGSLTFMIQSQSGRDSGDMVSQNTKGVWHHDTSYEIKAKGRHKLEVLLNEEPISGSPIEWIVKPRTIPKEPSTSDEPL